MTNIKEALQALQESRDRYPAYTQVERGKKGHKQVVKVPKNRLQGGLTEIQELECELLNAICDKIGVKNE